MYIVAAGPTTVNNTRTHHVPPDNFLTARKLKTKYKSMYSAYALVACCFRMAEASTTKLYTTHSTAHSAQSILCDSTTNRRQQHREKAAYFFLLLLFYFLSLLLLLDIFFFSFSFYYICTRPCNTMFGGWLFALGYIVTHFAVLRLLSFQFGCSFGFALKRCYNNDSCYTLTTMMVIQWERK